MVTLLVFAAGLVAGLLLDFFLLRTYFAPPFRIWPAPEVGSWQSLTFWCLFRGGMIATLAVAALDWNAVPMLDWGRVIVGIPAFLVGFGIAIRGYFNLGLGNTYCGSHGLVSHGLYRYSRNPQYTASIIGLFGLALAANSLLTIILAIVMSGAYVLMAFTEESWLEERYGASYREYCRRIVRFIDVHELLALVERKWLERTS
jgi:protein-S-isoprenylcysteine O-methyltransferase Ste14